MEYNRIVAVTGMPGLYEVVSSKTDGALVRSLEDKSTKFVSSRVHNLSHLESIEVYTIRDNVQLTDVFTAMKANSENLPNVKDNKALTAYFKKVFPELDFERVYASDMKKMVKWYETIKTNDIDFTVKEMDEEAANDTEKAPLAEEEKSTVKPAKPKTKKEIPPTETESATKEEKPKKPRKKTKEE